MAEQLDAVDAKILDLIQHDASLSVAEIAERVGLSSSPCWRRIKRLEDAGIIQRRVTILADEGIHAVVPAGTWEQLARETAATVRTSGPGAGLLQAVRRAGELLDAHGLARRSDDRNELADGVRG